MQKIKDLFVKIKEGYRNAMKVPRWAFLIRFGTAFAVTLVVLGGSIGLLMNYLFGGLDRDKVEQGDFYIDDTAPIREDLINIALFGIDTLDPEMSGRSDSIVIVTVDSKQGEIRMSAIQRDTYVEIEGYGKTKINHAYAYGGPVLAVNTLNQNFGLNITDYVVINFTNMEKVIDVLGGIQLEVSESYYKEANQVMKDLAAQRGEEAPDPIPGTGLQTLNGKQVLGMLRARYNVGGTEARSNMHEIVLQACLEKVKTISILQYPALVKSLMELVKTTLSNSEVTSLGMHVVTKGLNVRSAVFPLTADQPNGDGGKMINGVWYLTYNEETGNQHIRDFIYDGVLYGEDTTE